MSVSEWIILVVAAFCVGGIVGWYFGQKDGYDAGRNDELLMKQPRNIQLTQDEIDALLGKREYERECE